MKRPFGQPTVRSNDGGLFADEIRGTLERITFHNDETGYTVAQLLPDGAREPVTILGNFTNPVVGESLRCEGTWTHHPQWGRQLQVKTYESLRPASAHAIEKYLGSGMVRGVGPVMAKRIVAAFGDKALDIIEGSPDRLLEVPGIGAKRLDQIQEVWREQHEVRNIMLFLQSHGVSPAYAVKIYKTYREKSIDVVERNPYQLATDIWGIGFKSADKIASNLGFTQDDPRRISAGLVYVMNESVDKSGHVFLTRSDLAQAAGEILGPAEIDGPLEALFAAGRLVKEDFTTGDRVEEGIYTPSLLQAERELARRLHGLLAAPVTVDTTGAPRGVGSLLAEPAPAIPHGGTLASWIAGILSRADIRLSDEQTAAVELALTQRVCVLTGGPGTGKTTTTNAVVAALRALRKRVLLASPTGRAAKRLSEVTGCDASTIHRLLQYDPARRGFKLDADNPLECDFLLIDESSMLDLPLTAALIRALPGKAQVLFVGDVDQLASVGPGFILHDLIASKVVPTARLTTIFRQAAQSAIVTSAHAINHGVIPELKSPRESDGDFVFIRGDEAEEAAEKVVAIVARSLPKRGFAASDIQVLAPMQKGAAGALNLNARLQETLNPPGQNKAEVARMGRRFREGDRVIQNKNNYEKNVFNGDIGVVTEISLEESSMAVRMSDAEIVYDFSEIDELSLAYALTIHKSQGSEFPVAVIAIHTQHYALLQRNLLYTAVTRAKRYAVLVGSTRAIAITVRNDRQTVRHTRLTQRLQGLL